MHTKKHIFFCILFLISSAKIFSQNDRHKVFFDKTGKSCQEKYAYYFRQQTDTTEYYRSFYLSNGHIYFEGLITTPSEENEVKNIYGGNCKWYYKNGNLKFQKTYTEKGLETGTSKSYYESGKIWKEIEFENGKTKNSFYNEYNEDGTKNIIFEENFTNNFNEWDLFASDQSLSSISNGFFEIVSTSKLGTSRFINVPITSESYAIEALINTIEIRETDRIGLLYGFKDWQNYNYFVVSKKGAFIGNVFEGINSVDADGLYNVGFNSMESNNLKVICNGEKNYFSINGDVIYSKSKCDLYGNNFGFVLSSFAKLKADNFIVKSMAVEKISKLEIEPADVNIKATGSGILINSNGYIITNYHVIENANGLLVEISDNSEKKTFSAISVLQDKENDLAILKINDGKFKELPSLKYSFKENGQLDVGGTVFTIGYPLALNGMGKEAKFTDGKISAKTGYQGAINSFQTTIPVQPGNSGGPVFNNDGQLIGLINASVKNTDNVSYAIKLNYIKNLIELLTDNLQLPSDNSIINLSLEEKIKVLTDCVVLVKVK